MSGANSLLGAGAAPPLPARVTPGSYQQQRLAHQPASTTYPPQQQPGSGGPPVPPRAGPLGGPPYSRPPADYLHQGTMTHIAALSPMFKHF